MIAITTSSSMRVNAGAKRDGKADRAAPFPSIFILEIRAVFIELL